MVGKAAIYSVCQDYNGIVLHFLRVKHIAVHSGLDVLVAQTFHDGLGLGAILRQQRAVSMT